MGKQNLNLNQYKKAMLEEIKIEEKKAKKEKKATEKGWLGRYLEKRKNKKTKLYQWWQKHEDPGLAEYIMYLASPFRIFWTNLLAGIGRGLGFVLGATIVVALLVYVVSQILVEIPVVGHFFQWLNTFLQENIQNINIPGDNYTQHEAGGL